MQKAVLVFAALLLLSAQAEARPHHALPHRALHHLRYYRQAYAMAPSMGSGMASSGERVVGGRPAGCPNAFCGCEASLYKFGRIIPGLNLASNWRRFPRTAPAPGMAAVRSGHVMILESQVGGNVWTVHDGNSGGHVTREHARSLAGYTIVDPSGATGTFAFSNPGFANARSTNTGFASPRYANASFANSGFTNMGYANTGFANSGFTSTGFTNSWQGSYRQASRTRRIARAYGG
ncbi:MAG: hypothetical protein JO141_25710 [Bradyrhizobium sp.]|nr:hypothetical protein [Bradyrhizobium sp.]